MMTPAQFRQTIADQLTPLGTLAVKVGLPCALCIAGWVQVIVPAFQDSRENAKLQTQILGRMEKRADSVDRRVDHLEVLAEAGKAAHDQAAETHNALLASVRKLLDEPKQN